MSTPNRFVQLQDDELPMLVEGHMTAASEAADFAITCIDVENWDDSDEALAMISEHMASVLELLRDLRQRKAAEVEEGEG
jgi:hypothetical protein